MPSDKLGDKEVQVRALRMRRFEQRNAKTASISDLRKTVADIKPKERPKKAKKGKSNRRKGKFGGSYEAV